MKQLGRNIYIALLPLLTISFVAEVAPYISIPSLPSIAESLGLTQSAASSTTAAYFLAVSLTFPFVGIIGNIWDKKRLLLLSSLLVFAGSLGCALSDGYVMFVGGRILQGIGSAIVTVIGQTWIGQNSTQKNITKLFSYAAIFLSFAPLLAPIIGGFVNDTLTWRYNFYIVALLSLFPLAFIYRTTPPVPEQSYVKIPVKVAFAEYKKILFGKRFFPIMFATLICFLFQGALMSYSSFLFIDQMGLKSSVYGLISVPVVVGIIIGQFPVLFLEKRKGLRVAYIFNIIVAASALIGSLTYYFIHGSHTVAELAVVILIFNIGFGGHNLLATRNIMTQFASRRSYSSAIMNFTGDFTSYIAALVVQILFLVVGTASQIHNILCGLTIVLIIYAGFSFDKTIPSKD